MFRKAHIRQLLTVLLISFFVYSCQLFRVPDVDKEEEIEKEEKYPVAAYVEHELPKEVTSAGIEYAILEKGEGVELEPEMRVSLHYTGYLADELEVFDSSHDREEPISFIIGRGMVIPGWEEVLGYFRVGDKARVWVPYQLAYGETGRGPIPPRTDLVFDIEILDTGIVEVPVMWPVEDKDTLLTESGLKVIIIEDGTGEKPLRGSVLKVHYSGYLSDGTLFDSSVQRDVPLRFVLGASQVIRGLDEGFTLINEGTLARFIIPPHLAYGDRGSGPVPPAETLYFDVELIEIQY